MDSAIATTYNLRPEQKLQNHTEYPKHNDQFPSARTHPEPYRLPGSLDSAQHVIRENDKAHQRREMVTVPTMPLADRDRGRGMNTLRASNKFSDQFGIKLQAGQGASRIWSQRELRGTPGDDRGLRVSWSRHPSARSKILVQRWRVARTGRFWANEE